MRATGLSSGQKERGVVAVVQLERGKSSFRFWCETWETGRDDGEWLIARYRRGPMCVVHANRLI